MEEKKEIFGILDLLIRPGFCVKENRIVKCNAAGEALLFTPGTDVRTLLITGQAEYESFQGGCLYLKLGQDSGQWGATVMRLEGWDIFALDPPDEAQQLQVLELAAQQLRSALGNVMVAAQQLPPQKDYPQQTRLIRGLHQLLRLVGNMSDAGRAPSPSRQELTELPSLFAEIMEKAAPLLAQSGHTLHYTGLSQELIALADRDLLERAVLNILSNAAKFTPPQGTVTAALTRQGKLLLLSIEDSGPGIDPQIQFSMFSRYLRSPGIEESSSGLGLGMVLVRHAALSHGGTVLVDSPKGARITLTLALRQHNGTTLRSPILQPDYAGGWDHALLELADCLPPEAYADLVKGSL